VDARGNLFIADSGNNVIRKVDTNGIISTMAGNEGYSGYSGNGGAATSAVLSNPQGVAVDAGGNLFIADTLDNVIREIATNGIITTVAGNGTNGYSGDGGAATNAEFWYPAGLAVDAGGNLFIGDLNNHVLRKVDNNGIITTLIDLPGFSAVGVVVDENDNLFIADSGNNAIVQADSNGIVTTVAGDGTGGYSGDGGAATNAQLSLPNSVAVDTDGNLFIADSGNNVIRKVGTDGIITTVAGNGYGAGLGFGGYSGDSGAATNAELNNPLGVAVDGGGNLLIADTINSRIRKVTFNSSVISPTLLLSDVGVGNSGAYDVVVSNPNGSVTSTVVNVAITIPAVILSKPQITLGNHDFQFQVSGPAGSNVVVQVSNDLLNWSSVSTSTIPVSGFITVSNAMTGLNRQFYRAHPQ
jgi:sugar lactone lactonase YvrE